MVFNPWDAEIKIKIKWGTETTTVSENNLKLPITTISKQRTKQ